MALDHTIFLQGAALNQRQNEMLLDQLGKGIDNAYKNKALKIEAEKAKQTGFDLEKLAGQALVKREMGESLSPQETGVLKAYDTLQTRKMAVDPVTGGYYKPNASIFDGAPQYNSQARPVDTVQEASIPYGSTPFVPPEAQGFDVSALDAPIPKGPKVPLQPLNVGMLDDAQFAQYREGMRGQNAAMQENALPGLNLDALKPQAPISIPPDIESNRGARQKYLETAAEEAAKNTADASSKVVSTAKGKEKFEKTLSLLTEKLDQLNRIGGLPNEKNTNPGANISAYVAGSPIGQKAGRASASEAQSVRDEIASLRMGLKAALKEATGMSAQEMNSNTELQTFLDSITNPQASYQANIGMASNLSKIYGTGSIADSYSNKKEAPVSAGWSIRAK